MTDTDRATVEAAERALTIATPTEWVVDAWDGIPILRSTLDDAASKMDLENIIRFHDRAYDWLRILLRLVKVQRGGPCETCRNCITVPPDSGDVCGLTVAGDTYVYCDTLGNGCFAHEPKEAHNG